MLPRLAALFRSFVSSLPCSLLALCLACESRAADTHEELAAACDALAAEHKFSGVVLLARGDDVLVQRAYGLADVQAELPVTVDTRFLVASLTKPIVAFLTLRLVDAEELALDDRVAQHLPDLDGTALGDVSVHQLLTHTSGLPHYEAWPGFLDDVRLERSQAELLQLLVGSTLRSAPGAEFHYSGPGYLLLGMLLERVAGEALPELAQRWVFAPLDMQRSRLLGGAEHGADFARPYEHEQGALRLAPLRHLSTLGATGGLVSTAGDLHRFVRAIQRGQLLSPERHATLLTAARGHYACGLIVYRHPWTRARFARHLGSMDGVSAHFVFGLDDERVAIALANVGRAPVSEIDDHLIMRLPALAPDAAEERTSAER